MRFAGFAFALLMLSAAPAGAQSAMSQQAVADDPGMFLKTAEKELKWGEPADPVKIVGPIYFVGTKGLGSFLITGHEGHVLLNTGMPGSGELIEKSITALGFKPEDVKIILTGHAHVDHVGGHAYLAKATGAKIAMMREEVELFESGGAADFRYGDVEAFRFEPRKVDSVFGDKDEIKLGDITIQALLTAGHTQGSTTYVMKVKDGEETYTVVFADGTGVNSGYRFNGDPSYKGIGDAYRKTFRTLDALKPDIWLTPHNEAYGFDAKLAKSSKSGAAAWVDFEGYRSWVAKQRQKFEAAAAKEKE